MVCFGVLFSFRVKYRFLFYITYQQNGYFYNSFREIFKVEVMVLFMICLFFIYFVVQKNILVLLCLFISVDVMLGCEIEDVVYLFRIGFFIVCDFFVLRFVFGGLVFLNRFLIWGLGCEVRRVMLQLGIYKVENGIGVRFAFVGI